MNAVELVDRREDGDEITARYYKLDVPINDDITHIFLLTKDNGEVCYVRGGVPLEFCTGDVYNLVTDPVVNEVEECPYPFDTDAAYEFAMEHVLKMIDKYTVCELCGKRDTFAAIEANTDWKTICRDCGGEDPRLWKIEGEK